MRSLRRFLLAAAVAFAACAPAAGASERESVLWSALRGGGHAILLRHALAPGTGDPPGFRLDDCGTQRNLSNEGRAQAAAIGKAFRDNGVPVGRVLTSQWCRCRETAVLLALGPVEDYPALNSFYSDRSSAEEQTAALARFVGGPIEGPNIILVTHQVNITELTGVFPSSGEAVVVRPDGKGSFVVVGRLLIMFK